MKNNDILLDYIKIAFRARFQISDESIFLPESIKASEEFACTLCVEEANWPGLSNNGWY